VKKSDLGSYYSDFGLVTATNSGQPYSPRSLDKIWNKLRDSSELMKIRYHDLRHTHASLLLSANVHPKVVSERLGHSSIQMTIDLYSHIFPNMQSDAANELGRILFDSPDNE
jgi:integrase